MTSKMDRQDGNVSDSRGVKQCRHLLVETGTIIIKSKNNSTSFHQ